MGRVLLSAPLDTLLPCLDVDEVRPVVVVLEERPVSQRAEAYGLQGDTQVLPWSHPGVSYPVLSLGSCLGGWDIPYLPVFLVPRPPPCVSIFLVRGYSGRSWI